MKTKKPTAIIYNWDRKGTFTLNSEIYHEESLYEEVVVHSLENIDNVFNDFSLYKPDLVLSIGQFLSIDNARLIEKNTKAIADAVMKNNLTGAPVSSEVMTIDVKNNIACPIYPNDMDCISL